ncbi:hypothetical protein B9Z07_08605 [Burkholderia cenocepacia]|uniref:Uncharacterized protein n=1 Tax=Burkholderia cenocepacia TaxID=95486 RepID=A0AAD0IYZ3_9BURK|nr:hypothetical protein B9Z07_08605 [Burkholderia cenocepacia]RQV08380.1 hypothetical protein DF042_02475 [Burkholderia cenocepacia]
MNGSQATCDIGKLLKGAAAGANRAFSRGRAVVRLSATSRGDWMQTRLFLKSDLELFSNINFIYS